MQFKEFLFLRGYRHLKIYLYYTYKSFDFIGNRQYIQAEGKSKAIEMIIMTVVLSIILRLYK